MGALRRALFFGRIRLNPDPGDADLGYNAAGPAFLTWGGNMGLYSHYDGAHNHPVNRALHMIAIPVGFSSLIVVWWHWMVALLLIPTAFALAWLGHLIEGNKPAFLTNPAHVFVAPVWMAREDLRDESEEDGAVAVRIPSQPVGTHISLIPPPHA